MKKVRVFYGWYIVLAGMLITIIHGAVYVYGFGAFFIHFQNAFNASRAQIGLVLGLSRLEGGLVAPVSGYIVDRFGPRRPMLFGLVLVGFGFILLSRVNTLIMFYAVYVGLLATGSSFGSARPIQISLANWFIRRRSRVMGFLMTGFGIGGSLVFAYSWVIETFGWRTACVFSALLILVVSIPLALVIRHRPEDMGLLPDGEDPANWKNTPASGESESVDKSNSVLNETNLTARQAMSTKAFWILALVFATWSLVPPTITAHMIPYLQQELGASPAIAALSLSGFAFISLFGRIPIGWLGDYVNLRYLLAILFVFMGLGMLILAQIQTTAYIPLALIVMGPAYGGSVPVRPALQGYLFGRMAFGTIGGLLQFFDLPAAIAAPVFVGWIADEYSYRLGFRIVAGLIIIGSLAVLAAKPPPKDIYR
jgi:OFA family oxalate/formate antiporter-like MFS transporter